MHSTMFADHAIATKKELSSEEAMNLVKHHIEKGTARFDNIETAPYQDSLFQPIPEELEVRDIELEAGDYLLIITWHHCLTTSVTSYQYDCWAIS